MIDTSNAKWEFSDEEKYVIQWLNDKDFSGKLVKQYLSKTIFEVEKDGIKEKLDLPQLSIISDIKGFMEQFEYRFEMAKKLEQLMKETRQNDS